MAKALWVLVSAICTFCLNAQAESEATRVTVYARDLLTQAGQNAVEFRTVKDLDHDEAFRVVQKDGKITIEHEKPAGALYGAQAVIRGEYESGKIERPDFRIRGTTLPLFTGNGYNATLSPETFPWFYDRAFMTRTLDAFAEARFNTIFLWGSHTFPYIVEMPQYPEASADVPPGQVKANQEQFLWFTGECERHNIQVLLHFYNIHVSPPFAKKHGIPTNPIAPTPLLREYTHYALSRYFEVFPSVGLYACPGESIHSTYQMEWFRDVIFDAAKKSGKNPMIVIRDWTLNSDFREQLKQLYDNCYSELKQNDESLSSPYPDIRHMKWEGLTAGHIINAAHGPAEDLVPMRWANPLFVQEMAQHWKSLGFVQGVEFWAQSFWEWPYTYDRVTPRLLYLDRDDSFYTVVGRYLWSTERDPGKERVFWTNHYSKQFDSQEAGELIARWYELSGSIGPGILNLNATRVANWWSAVVLMNQNIDQILTYNKSLDETPYTLNREAGRANQRFYPRPYDAYFFERYRSKYRLPIPGKTVPMFKEFYPFAKRMNVDGLEQRTCMPVTQYATYLTKNLPVESAMTPDKVSDLLYELACEALDLAEIAAAAGDAPHKAELHRFVTDSQIFKLATEALRAKEHATILKACMLLENSYDEKRADAFLKKMEESVQIYQTLSDLGNSAYERASFCISWKEGLDEFTKDLKTQQDWLNGFKILHNKSIQSTK
jgi:hypothetical protein